MTMSLRPESLGRLLTGKEALEQRIEQIITTAVGSVPTEREFGSKVYQFIDRPVSEAMSLRISVAEALDRQEPEFVLENVGISIEPNGGVVLDVTGDYVPFGQPRERVRRRINI